MPAVIDTGAHGGLIIVDKPAGITSHDVVARVRRLAATRRVGHAGTLDPMATGVLVIGVEKATRLLGYLTLTEKTYAATIRLGQSTSTDDAEGEPTGGSGAATVIQGALHEAIASLTGEIMQVPPGVSAIKINGQRAYKLTRAGAAPEMKPRPVTVHEFTVTDIRRAGDFLDLDALIRCSSGTYIRALARDLGQALGVGGHLTALRRTAVGPYRVAAALTLEELANNQSSTERGPLIPLADAAAAAFPRVDLTADESRRLAHGARLPLPAELSAGMLALSATTTGVASASDLAGGENPIAAFAPDGTLVALVAVDAGLLRSLAVFAGGSRVNFEG
jgi:tRNA pseudouridine55 synthase